MLRSEDTSQAQLRNSVAIQWIIARYWFYYTSTEQLASCGDKLEASIRS